MAEVAGSLPTAGAVAFVGPFGTGKTEVAINYSLAVATVSPRLLLVDLDIVTPYFRVGDCREQLEALGVRVIAAEGALASFENPSLSPEIAGALRDADARVVLDVGGDPVGARLLRSYRPQVMAREHEVWLVVNPYRLGSAVDSIEDQRRATEEEAGLQVTGLVANPHLGPLTQPSHIEEGLRVVREIGGQIDLPIVFLAVAERLVADLRVSTPPVLPLRRFQRLPWEAP